jgi:hypothetical protein
MGVIRFVETGDDIWRFSSRMACLSPAERALH